MKKRQYTIWAIVVAVGLVLCVAMLAFSSGESKNGTKKPVVKQNQTKEQPSTAPIINAPTAAESVVKVECIIRSLDIAKKNVTFYDYENQMDEFFRMDLTPTVYTEYGTATTLDQLYPGLVVDIEYEENKRELRSIKVCDEVSRFRGVTGMEVNVGYGTMAFYNHFYAYNKDVIIASGDYMLKPDQISGKDLLTVYSKDSKVISVVVDKGHGYLSVTGVDLFEGGYITVGDDLFKTITKGMMLTVAEGDYKVSVSHNGYRATKTVKIERDMVQTVDFSEFVKENYEVGNVLFEIPYVGAKLYINGELRDYTEGIITLPVGNYSVSVICAGYESFVDKIEVDNTYKKISISLTPEETKEEPQTETTAEISTEKETTGNIVSTKNRVYIDGPMGALVYFDEQYVGIAPLSFALVTGQHTILIINGTQGKSYTVTLAEGPDDVRYDFTNK